MGKSRPRPRPNKRDEPADSIAVPRRFVWALLALAGAGFGISVYLTYAYYRLHSEPGWHSACAFSSEVSCDSALMSRYASVVGIPLSTIGAWYYALTAILATLELRRRRASVPKSPVLLLLIGAAAASVVSIALGVLSVRSVGSLCPLCVILYGINGALFGVAWLAFRKTSQGLGVTAKTEWVGWTGHPLRAGMLIAVAVVPLLLVRGSGRDTSKGSLSESSGKPPSDARANPHAITGDDASPLCEALAAASPDNPITLTIYSDFQCHSCRDLDVDLRKLPASVVRLLHEHFPQDTMCNPRAKVSRHPGACRQALAAICATAQGQEAEFRNRVFDGDVRDQGELVKLAGSLGLNVATFESCLESETVLAQLRGSVGRGIEAGVRATPTIFMSGSQHVGHLHPEDQRCLTELKARWR